MPKINHILNSFNAGELSGKLDARIDQEKYAFGARTMENFIAIIYGGAERRPGTEFIAGQNSNSAKGRVEGFEHSVDDVYALLFENQRLQVFTGGTSPSAVFKKYGTEDLSGVGTPIAHWKCNDNLATTAVVDATGNGHTGTAQSNTSTMSVPDAEGTANKALDIDDNDWITVADHNDLSFGDGTTDSPLSIIGWFDYDDTSALQYIVEKGRTGGDTNEYILFMHNDQLKFELHDESDGGSVKTRMTDTVSTGWHFFGITYSGVVDSDAVANDSSVKAGIRYYVDFIEVPAIIQSISSYTAMENLGEDLYIGAVAPGATGWDGVLDNISLWGKELSPVEIASLTGNDQSTVFSITTPYLTADIPTLKFEQSADVMFITHPSYESRRLSRFGDASWSLDAAGIETGPFRDENSVINKTIVSSATTGAVTLTAVGHSPFITGATAGHSPSGTTSTSKSITGALFKLVHATDTPSIAGAIDSGTLNNASATLAIPKGITWDLTTNGTWGTAGNSASVVLERSYDEGTTYETVVTVTSAANKNIVTSGTEDFADAIYRTRTSEAGGDNSICSTQLSLRDTSHIGIVRITSVTSGTVALGIVVKTLGSTDKTHRWSEGSFSNYRGWPIDVTISAEERLTFAGLTSKPLTTYGSKTGDFTDYAAGTDDDDPVTFTLVGTGQQNRIRWILSKDVLVIGTVGGEHLLGASKDDEALTPTNVRARLQTTKGSEDIAAIAVGQAILFVQRGGKRIRELLYNFESDSHKADDLTVFADHIMGTGKTDGVVDMAYQRTPDPVLWCVRNDGQMAVMSYERDQKVFAWSRYVTVDGDADSDFESVAVIYGGTRSEDEVWVTVRRTIGGGDVRYVERFKPRNWGTDDEDAFFVDSGLTYDSTDVSTVTAAHLKNETCSVFADGVVFDEAVADASTGVITLKKDGVATKASVVQYGLGYTSTLQPMKLNIENQGRAATYHILGGVLSLFKTMRGEWGENINKMNPIIYRKEGQTSAEFPLTTDDIEMAFQGGQSRSGDVIIRQTDPVPMTVLAMYLDVEVNAD